MKRTAVLIFVVMFLVSLNGCAGNTNSGLDDNIGKEAAEVINGYCSSLENHDIDSLGKYVSKSTKKEYQKFKSEFMDPVTECKVESIDLDNAKFDKNNPPKKIQVLVRYNLKAKTKSLGARDLSEPLIEEVFTLKRQNDRYIITDCASPYTMVPPWSVPPETTNP